MVNNRFLDNRWLNAHLIIIKERAGNRYTPELNIDLPIAEIFDGISRTENFYATIRKHYGKLNREFSRVSKNFGNDDIQKLYKTIEGEISQLSKLLGKLKEYNTERIPWDKIKRRTMKVSEILWKISDELREEKEKAEKQRVEEERSDHRLDSERIGSDIRYLYEMQKELRYFEELSSSTKARLSNYPFLFLTGIAGTGKTHLLCDVVEDRITGNKELAAILVFGEFITTIDDPIMQIIRQLDLKIKTNQFLRQLDNAGKQAGCRAIITIDALNETRQRKFWKKNLGRVVDEIKKYPNVALVVSVRTGFEEEISTKKVNKDFVHEEHRGFEFREWEAVHKFFEEFQLPLPEIPLLMPEFQNPLFLLLFCKAFQDRAKKNNGKKQKQVFRGHEGATYIFESFVDSVSKKIAKQFNIPNGAGKNIWDSVIEKIAAEMVDVNDDRISEDQVVSLVKGTHPSIDHGSLIKELERNLLVVKVPRYSKEKNDYEGFDFRFPFQKFSDHLIGRYLFKKYEQEFEKANKNLQTAKKYFSKRRKLGKFLAESWNRGVVEALSIQCPEHLKGCELVEVAPYLKSSYLAQEAFVESLIWRKPTAFSVGTRNTLAYINRVIVRTESGHNNLLNALLAVAPVPNHPLNADFLHKHLSSYSMPKRDSWWSTFLHYHYGNKGAVDRLVEWGWSDQDKAHINDEGIRLCSTGLCWFLTTPNRFLRDKATKALVALLTSRLSVVLELLKQFKDVNDPYVAERLYAVAYGCAVRSRGDKKGLRALSEWVYDEIFKQGNPPVHILLRDYARGIIEVALQEQIKIRISRKKIEPPYQSQFPKKMPTNKTIKKYQYNSDDKNYKDYFQAQNSIIYSMQPEYSEKSMYGDFGRYTFQSALSHFDYKKEVTMQKLSNWATKRVFDLGYDVKLHGQFDRYVDDYRAGRIDHKAERIGKKYQWIAMHELLARVADKYQFLEDEWAGRTSEYEGPWQLWIRDIDPTCILKDYPNATQAELPCFESYNKQSSYDAWNKNISDSAWLRDVSGLPNPKKIIELTDNKGYRWVVIEGFIEWQEETPPEIEKYGVPSRTMWYMIKSYLVNKHDKEKVFRWAKKQKFTGQWMPVSHEFFNIYLGEYPSAQSFKYQNIAYYHHNGWTDKTRNEKIPGKVLVADDVYSSTGSSIDCSTADPIKVKLPAKLIFDEMELTQKNIDGRYFDNCGQLIALDLAVYYLKMPNHLIIRKDKLQEYLESKGYAIIWTVLGEKYMVGGNHSEKKWLGRLDLSGTYALNDKQNIIGTVTSNFKNS